MASDDETEWVDFFILHEGERYFARYSLIGDTVTVTTSEWSRSTQKGGMTVFGIARTLLREMIERDEADPD